MNKLVAGSALILIASFAFSLSLRHRAQAALDQRQALVQVQAGQLEQLSADNRQLSNLVAQLGNSQSLSGDQLRELLKLRNEAGQLRAGADEKEKLQAANAQLRARAAKSEKALAEAQAAPNYWPKDQLSFAGYADPESAVRSMLWAMNKGDVSGWRTICTPEALARMEAEWERHGRSEAERVAEMKAMSSALVSGSSGFHVLDREMPAPDVAIVNVSFDGEGSARKFQLHKIGGEWKFHDFVFDGQNRR